MLFCSQKQQYFDETPWLSPNETVQTIALVERPQNLYQIL